VRVGIRFAAGSRRFGFVLARRGLVPEGASSWFLPRLVGISRGTEWTFTGRVFPAVEALAGGLVRSVHPDEELLPPAYALAREIEVMKLVGATNWFIRIPFMAEGLVQGIIGGAVGIGIVMALRSWLLPTLVSGGGIWAGFRLTLTDVQGTGVVLIIAGALVGVFGSAVAATRFLDV